MDLTRAVASRNLLDYAVQTVGHSVLLKPLFITAAAIAVLVTARAADAQPDVLNLQGGSSALCPGPEQLSMARPL